MSLSNIANMKTVAMAVMIVMMLFGGSANANGQAVQPDGRFEVSENTSRNQFLVVT
jgi:hypothetical protein